MEKYFVLSQKNDSPDIGHFLLLKNNKLYNVRLEMTHFEGKIFPTIKKGFKYCDIQNDDLPETALFTYGQIYSKDECKDIYRLTEINFNLQAGEYYSRVWRPFLQERENEIQAIMRKSVNRIEGEPQEEIRKLKDYIEKINSKEHYPLQNDQDIIVYSVNQFAVLKEMLQVVLNNVSLAEDNFETYSNNLLNLLVVSCIEVENQLKGIFREHESIPKTNGFYKTTDYVKLNSILHLDQYEAFFSYYPNVSSFKPFENWDTTQPTKSIAWYDSYNMVKHDSFANINQANLKNVLNSICAVAILFHAQFGNDVPYWNERIGNFIQVKNKINWKLEECIIPPYEINQWTKTKLNI